jgi:hypothetical protein
MVWLGRWESGKPIYTQGQPREISTTSSEEARQVKTKDDDIRNLQDRIERIESLLPKPRKYPYMWEPWLSMAIYEDKCKARDELKLAQQAMRAGAKSIRKLQNERKNIQIHYRDTRASFYEPDR